MGTNYYWHPKEPCEACGREYAPIHIGKSSGGWAFALHVKSFDEDDGAGNDLDCWKEKLKEGQIFDEYGKAITRDQMLDVILRREMYRSPVVPDAKWLEDNHAYWDEEYGLARCNSVSICVCNGEDGPYDMIIGDFS